jgi:curved DNA-binding protein CbpA
MSDVTPNYYQILHVQPNAPTEIIKSSYRALMMQCKQHPDLGGDHETAALINAAYEILKNPAKRAAYDQELQSASAARTAESRKPVQPSKHSEAVRPAARKPAEKQDYTSLLASACAFCRTPHPPGLRVQADSHCHRCASPLYPARQVQLESSGQRALERMARSGGIEVFSAWPHKGLRAQTRDLSPAGMQLTARRAFKTDQVVQLSGSGIQAIGRVASCRKEGKSLPASYAIGVQFITLQFEQTQGTFVSYTV